MRTVALVLSVVVATAASQEDAAAAPLEGGRRRKVVATEASQEDDKPIFAKGFVRQPRNANAYIPSVVITQEMRASVPDKKDWSEEGATSPIKNQGRCGSCWAFSATEGVESGVFMSTGKMPPPLAIQQLVACDSVDGGCNGGDLPSAFNYITKDGGLDSESNYPDTSSARGVTGNCVSSHGHVATITKQHWAVPECNTRTCANQDEEGVKAVLATKGPLSICVNANDWNDYTGGVGLPNGAACSGNYRSLDHCVQLVGYDMTGSEPYWKVRNSWGTRGWGEAGFIRLPYGSNYCGVADEVMYIEGKLVSSDVAV